MERDNLVNAICTGPEHQSPVVCCLPLAASHRSDLQRAGITLPDMVYTSFLTTFLAPFLFRGSSMCVCVCVWVCVLCSLLCACACTCVECLVVMVVCEVLFAICCMLRVCALVSVGEMCGLLLNVCDMLCLLCVCW